MGISHLPFLRRHGPFFLALVFPFDLAQVLSTQCRFLLCLDCVPTVRLFVLTYIHRTFFPSPWHPSPGTWLNLSTFFSFLQPFNHSLSILPLVAGQIHSFHSFVNIYSFVLFIWLSLSLFPGKGFEFGVIGSSIHSFRSGNLSFPTATAACCPNGS
ncbi:hypothetical protein F5Y04DRAFT_195493 [Hypomontagnella monticulosa]|nr:hypothetical protein F5Y04DRAFT_195493 [Hypomontagnella monticulosa]